MNINRFNYEEYFLLYTDGELNAADKQAVEQFVQENPDLRGELDMLLETVLRVDRKLTFDDKASLLRNSAPANPVNESNYEEYFILYGDDELTNEEKDQVEQFVYKNSAYQSDFELMQQVRLSPDTSVLFPDKSLLYRSEKDEKVVVIRWWRIAAAAVVFISLGLAAWLYLGDNKNPAAPEVAQEIPSTHPKPANIINDKEAKAPALATADEKDVIEPNSITPSEKTGKQIVQPRLVREEQPLLAVNPTLVKKSSNLRNIPEETTVTPIETGIVAAEHPIKAGIEKRIVDEAVTFEELSKDDPQPMTATYASNDGDQIQVLNTSVSNKSKMRGFFRKVGRVVDKATNFAPAEENPDKKGVRIASFQIALK
ncbi:MAG: hypothetical protein H7Y31_17720 [Chitinophagaceae bacterium]|nr:hypothetical protein [Chitinophagaceae bacterium]